jgi:hypothetical protein
MIFDRDKKALGELFLIIGGFALTDTLIRKYIELSNNVLPWYIPSLLAFLLIMIGLNLRDNIKDSKFSYFSYGFIIISVVLLVFSLNGKISIWWYIGTTLVWGILIIIWTFSGFSKRDPNDKYLP